MKKKNKIIIFIVIIILIIIALAVAYKVRENKIAMDKIITKNNNHIQEVASHYNQYVKTIKKSKLYSDTYEEEGYIGENVELILDKIKINKNTKYFKITNLDKEYYINYKNVEKIDNIIENNDRYKKYIPFNENIITKDKISFYDENDNLVLELNNEHNLPIIIKEDAKYGVEFNNRLLYVKKEDIENVVENKNTELKNSSGVGVLNYHAFYDADSEESRNGCRTSICHSNKQFRSQLEYLKENNILTLKMKELEMYIDGKIQLPKSVLITIDDGGRTQIGIDLLTEYKMYATIFLITSWFDPDEYYKTEYIELHSHSDNMHNQGDCPTGQGGAIQCKSEEFIQNDLKKSREKLNNTTYFCYPFYEYNSYSERMLKEAGFTMAFVGESLHSDNLAHVGCDKFKIKRFVISTYTTPSDFSNYFLQIK